MELPPGIIGLLGFTILFVFIFLNVPISIAFAFTGFLGIWYVQGLTAALGDIPMTLWANLSSYTLTAIPLFVIMGLFAFHSGIGPDLYETALKWWGKLPGGLAMTTTWGSCAFGAVTGSSSAAVLSFTPIAWKPMLALGYDKRLASGSIICSATMAVLIPPSLAFILYGAITQESISRLFIAGIFPGLLQAAMYTTTILFLTITGLQAGPPGPGSTWKEKFLALRKVWGMLTIFLLVIGGIYLGIFTPTEGAAVGAAGTFVILVLRQGFNVRIIMHGLEETLRTAGMILLIIAASIIFADFLSLSGVYKWLVGVVTGVGANPYLVLATAIIILLIAGCIMPATPMILLFTPLFYPVFVGQFGFSGIWFGVIIVLMTEFAVITPPVGMNLFAFKSMVKEDIGTVQMWQGVIPFLIADAIRLVILIAFPVISLWLPGRMFQ